MKRRRFRHSLTSLALSEWLELFTYENSSTVVDTFYFGSHAYLFFFTQTPEISVTQFTIKNKHQLAEKKLSLDDEVEVWRPLQNTINSLNFSVVQKLSRFVCAYMRSRTFQFTENLNTENWMRKFHWNENEVPLFAFHLWYNKSHVSSGCHGSHIAMVKSVGISFSKIEKSRWIYCVENVKYNLKLDSWTETFFRMISSKGSIQTKNTEKINRITVEM